MPKIVEREEGAHALQLVGEQVEPAQKGQMFGRAEHLIDCLAKLAKMCGQLANLSEGLGNTRIQGRALGRVALRIAERGPRRVRPVRRVRRRPQQPSNGRIVRGAPGCTGRHDAPSALKEC